MEESADNGQASVKLSDPEEKEINEKINKPSHVSQAAIWDKFQLLKRKREDITKQSTAKRITILQKGIFNKVAKELNQPEDKEVLLEHNIVLPHGKGRKEVAETKVANEPPTTTEDETPQSEWKEVQKYIGCNDHLKGIPKGQHAPKNKIEKEIDDAIEHGDFEKAESLSDHLANREVAHRITEAIDAKTFDEKRQEQQKQLKEKSQNKLVWGFEPKQRWETKSNM